MSNVPYTKFAALGHFCVKADIFALQHHMSIVAMDAIRENATSKTNKLKRGSEHIAGDSDDDDDDDDDYDDDPPRAAAATTTPATDLILSECKVENRQSQSHASQPARCSKNSGSGSFTDIEGSGREVRICCNCCMRTAALSARYNFTSRHRRCGLPKAEPKRRAKTEQPRLIVLKEQNVYGIKGHVRRLLCCTICANGVSVLMIVTLALLVPTPDVPCLRSRPSDLTGSLKASSRRFWEMSRTRPKVPQNNLGCSHLNCFSGQSAYCMRYEATYRAIWLTSWYFQRTFPRDNSYTPPSPPCRSYF